MSDVPPAPEASSSPQPEAPRSASPLSRVLRGIKVLLRLGILALAFIAAYIILSRWDEWQGAAGPQWTDDAYLHANVTPLSAQVPGYIDSVPVADFQAVKQGDLIASIVDKDYKAKVAQAEANLASAEASLEHIRALRSLQKYNIAAAAAAIQAKEAILTRNRLEANRQQTIFASRIAGTQERVQQAVASKEQSAADLEQNKAQLEAAKQQLAVYDAQEEQASASISAQKAALELARINLGRTRISAPADGMVSQRQAQPGQYAGVGTQITTFVPLPKVWVIANYKETQLTHLEIGQPATITVDTFPGVIIKGHVESYAPAAGAVLALLPPDNATGNFTKVVRRIPVKVAIDDPAGLDYKLRPGMSVTSTIDTSKPGRSFQAADRGG